MTRLLQVRAEELKSYHSDIGNIPLGDSRQERWDYVLAYRNYLGAVDDVMDFEHLLKEDITDDTAEL